jgi:hypothetical protein
MRQKLPPGLSSGAQVQARHQALPGCDVRTGGFRGGSPARQTLHALSEGICGARVPARPVRNGPPRRSKLAANEPKLARG